ncbi:hypothetical protein KCU74_g42, partial [Aureobasidium melanogenum]
MSISSSTSSRLDSTTGRVTIKRNMLGAAMTANSLSHQFLSRQCSIVGNSLYKSTRGGGRILYGHQRNGFSSCSSSMCVKGHDATDTLAGGRYRLGGRLLLAELGSYWYLEVVEIFAEMSSDTSMIGTLMELVERSRDHRNGMLRNDAGRKEAGFALSSSSIMSSILASLAETARVRPDLFLNTSGAGRSRVGELFLLLSRIVWWDLAFCSDLRTAWNSRAPTRLGRIGVRVFRRELGPGLVRRMLLLSSPSHRSLTSSSSSSS